MALPKQDSDDWILLSTSEAIQAKDGFSEDQNFTPKDCDTCPTQHVDAGKSHTEQCEWVKVDAPEKEHRKSPLIEEDISGILRMIIATTEVTNISFI